jgi:hypothetical protein
MKALTLWQPWAHAIVHLGKRIENRRWPPPKYLKGQAFAIHAGKGFDEDSTEELKRFGMLARHVGRDYFDRGAVVAVARLKGSETDIEKIDGTQRFWFAGPVGWILTDVRPVRPVVCRGAQGLWNLPPEIEREVVRETGARLLGWPAIDCPFELKG